MVVKKSRLIAITESLNIKTMRKIFSTFMFLLMFPLGVSMAMSAADNKDNKSDKKKGHQPVIIIVWEPAWSPVMRETSPLISIDPNNTTVENRLSEQQFRSLGLFLP